MSDRAREQERSLRDYPISLRQSARAVFGSPYERAEKQAQHGDGPAKDVPLIRS